MTWLVITAIGIWIALSGFILLIVCMNSSRLSQMQEPMRRYPPRIKTAERRVIAEVQNNATQTSGN